MNATHSARSRQTPGSEAIGFIDRKEVSRCLSYEVCIPVVRDAIMALSKEEDETASSLDHPAVRWAHVRNHARRNGRTRRLRCHADQRLSRKLRARNPVAPGPRSPLRPRYGRACHVHSNRSADRICSLTPASEPILRGAWVRPGTDAAIASCSKVLDFCTRKTPASSVTITPSRKLVKS